MGGGSPPYLMLYSRQSSFEGSKYKEIQFVRRGVGGGGSPILAAFPAGEFLSPKIGCFPAILGRPPLWGFAIFQK